jgi:hypothetical protein
MATKARRLCRRPCGGYTVAIRRRRIYVTCGVCGESGPFNVSAARTLARRVEGLLGRFETPAPREERARLAELLRGAANAIEAVRLAERLREARRQVKAIARARA